MNNRKPERKFVQRGDSSRARTYTMPQSSQVGYAAAIGKSRTLVPRIVHALRWSPANAPSEETLAVPSPAPGRSGGITACRACARLTTCILLLSLLVVQPASGQAAASDLMPIRMQLKWSHQFQFAGFYTAAEKGYYRDAGLDVSFVEGRAGVDFVGEVVTGSADFGVEMPDLLLRRAAGDPVVVLAAIYQHSPYVLGVLEQSRIASPHDLAGHKIKLRASSSAEIKAMLLNEGVPLDQVHFVDHDFNAESLAKGAVDAMTLYSTTIAHEASLRGVPLTLLHPITYGVDFYGDCLFTSEHMIARYPDQVRAFRAASLRGWEYAMDHPREIAELINARYAPGKSVDALMAEAEAMEPLLLHKFVEPGHMNPGRWRHIADTFASVGLLPPGYSLEGFIFDANAAPDVTGLKWVAGLALAGLLIAGGVSLGLLLFNRRLDRAVHDRTADLERLNRTLEMEVREREAEAEKRHNLELQIWHAQKLESLGLLAGGIAHDFNNLLTVILGSADMALQLMKPGAPARPLVDEIRRASGHAADLTRQMLAYSGRGHLEVRDFNLNDLVDEMARLLGASVAKNVRITRDLAPDLPSLRADSAQIKQVIMNLITNAAESIPGDQPGEVTLTTLSRLYAREELEKSRIPEIPEAGEYICLQVTDNGSGMDPATVERLFEPFFTTKVTGRGLGMSATLGIVRGHHGAIMVDSGESGTIVRVLLPPAPVAAPSEDAPAPVANRDWQGWGTVLLVDDEEAVRTLAARMLERIGFNVLVAGDGVEGVEVFTAHVDTIRCVLLDFSMPRMDGVQASQQIQQIRPGVPIIVCSGFNQHDVEHRFEESSIAAFLHKPFRYEQIREAFRVALGGS